MKSTKKWDRRFMKLSKHIGEWSKDPATKLGCVIVNQDGKPTAMGYNGFPSGIDDEDDTLWERPLKYKYIIHAEANAMYYAAKMGISLKGCTLYIRAMPCTECAKGIVSCGIKRVVVDDPNYNLANWGDDYPVVRKIFKKQGIKLDVFKPIEW